MHCNYEPQRTFNRSFPPTSHRYLGHMPGTLNIPRYNSKILLSTLCRARLTVSPRGNSSFVCLISLDTTHPDLGTSYPRLSANATSRMGKDRKSSLTATPGFGELYSVNAVPHQWKRCCLPTRTRCSEANRSTVSTARPPLVRAVERNPRTALRGSTSHFGML